MSTEVVCTDSAVLNVHRSDVYLQRGSQYPPKWCVLTARFSIPTEVMCTYSAVLNTHRSDVYLQRGSQCPPKWCVLTARFSSQITLISLLLSNSEFNLGNLMTQGAVQLSLAGAILVRSRTCYSVITNSPPATARGQSDTVHAGACQET